ncbi:histone-like nucleoid-structuring protein Lsr2 [Streptomyces sp. NPDC096040]|uniref:Lsr2 family DNA-binding protein n=1 Tax=Streptomyces sp. NPDC096040 TaxID=3155541 RepID=UPI0033195ED2
MDQQGERLRHLINYHEVGHNGTTPGTCRPEDEPIRLWARTNGYLVNDCGRIPATIREAYEASQR